MTFDSINQLQYSGSMKYLAILLGILLVGCSTTPMTPQQAAAYEQMGAAFTNYSNQLQQQNNSNERDCQTQPDGVGGWRTYCRDR